MAFQTRQLVTAVVDLARFTQAVGGMDAVAIAEVLDRFYGDVVAVAADEGGRVVKFLGDGCLLVFPADQAPEAVRAVRALSDRVAALARELALDLELGANVHLCTVAEGAYEATQAYEVVGQGVIHTFRMGGGPGIRISEPVYRKLPSNQRGPWDKHQPPAVYTLTIR
jgi:class 3 adenylate cyclase